MFQQKEIWVEILPRFNSRRLAKNLLFMLANTLSLLITMFQPFMGLFPPVPSDNTYLMFETTVFQPSSHPPPPPLPPPLFLPSCSFTSCCHCSRCFPGSLETQVQAPHH